MGTIVGIAVRGGVVLGGDGRTVEGGVVTGRAGRLWDGGDTAAAVIGPQGDVDAFVRSFSAELKRQETSGRSLSLQRVASIARDLTREAGVDAIVAARDEDGVARIREVGSDGSILETTESARGSGMEVAIGTLESAGDVPFEDAESVVRDALEAAADRDTETGDEFDIWRLADAD